MTELTYLGVEAPRVIVSGATGFIGQHLIKTLRAENYSDSRLVRNDPKPGDILWDVDKYFLPDAELEDATAVIHLAGENILTTGLLPGGKEKVYTSRVRGTRLISEALAALVNPPPVLICASGVGFYGNRPHEKVTEASTNGSGWLAEVCRDWEAATLAAEKKGIRVVHLRMGVVLSPDGGMLKTLLPIFKAGFGGKIGQGKQGFSWISMTDLMSAIIFILRNPQISGPVNLTTPYPVTNAEFSKTLASMVKKPALMNMPAFFLKTIFKEKAQSLFLDGVQAYPTRLQEAGFEFQYPTLKQALTAMLD